MASRRSAQWRSPQVWDEDGTPNPFLNGGRGAGSLLSDFLHHGWAAFFSSVNDMWLLMPKAISAVSLGVSFSLYPQLGTALSWGFIGLVSVAVAVCPTRLAFRPLCALCVFLVPTDPEVFGLTLYTFWWASLLLFLVVLWDERAGALPLRLTLLLVGGLSSPVVVLIAPLAWLRAWRLRLRNEVILAAVSTALAALQLVMVRRGAASAPPPLRSVLLEALPTLIGRFGWGSSDALPRWLVAIAVLMVAAAWLVGNRRALTPWLLVALLFGVVAMSAVRVDPAALHPQLGGPRYFFFPFVLIFWVLVQCFHASRSLLLRGAVIAIAAAAVVRLPPMWSRAHDDLRWADHVRSCPLFERYSIPVQFDGHQERAWWLHVAGSACAAQLGRELLTSAEVTASAATYPFRVDPGFKPEPAFVGQRLPAGGAELQLQRGASVFVRSGGAMASGSVAVADAASPFLTELPVSTEWLALEFSNARLPPTFTAHFRPAGSGDGWLEVAVAAAR